MPGAIAMESNSFSAWTRYERSNCDTRQSSHVNATFERAERFGEFWSYPSSRAFAELVIDCEEDRTLRAVLVGMLREAHR